MMIEECQLSVDSVYLDLLRGKMGTVLSDSWQQAPSPWTVTKLADNKR